MKIQLGDRVRDVVTGFEGVVIGRTQWITGCDQAIVQPPSAKGTDDRPAAMSDNRWFDFARLEIVGERVQLPAPSDANAG